MLSLRGTFILFYDKLVFVICFSSDFCYYNFRFYNWSYFCFWIIWFIIAWLLSSLFYYLADVLLPSMDCLKSMGPRYWAIGSKRLHISLHSKWAPVTGHIYRSLFTFGPSFTPWLKILFISPWFILIYKEF